MTSIKRTPSCLATNARSPKLRNSLMPIARPQRNKRQKQRTKPWPCLGKLLPPKTVSTLLPTHPIWKFAPSAKAPIRWLSNITTASTMILNVWDLTEKPRWCPHLEPTPAVFARMREPNPSHVGWCSGSAASSQCIDPQAFSKRENIMMAFLRMPPQYKIT